MNSFLDEMLGGEGNQQARTRIRSLWEEYEARETPEAKLVKDLDRLELVLQAGEYERAQDNSELSCFFRGAIREYTCCMTKGFG
jgi:putative hydrolase of HD superfamily